MQKIRILSGIKPSGRPHIGNYLGAMRQHVSLQNEGHECFYMIADLHALTTLRDAEKLRNYRREIALDYLALGIDPEKSTLFFQSDVSAHTELAWILSSIAPQGLLERAHAWKDAQNNEQREKNIGLFTYPILMAADILLYETNGVPVGKDQKQHVEIARDLAEKFNHHFGECFTLPNPMINEDVATIRGVDGQKMSKSNNNTIGIFEDEESIKSQVMSIKTASLPLDAPLPIENDIILEIHSHFATESEQEELKTAYAKGGLGYGNAKKILLERLNKYFAEARKRREDLEKTNEVEKYMQAGAEKANMEANKKLKEVYAKVGLN